MKSWSKPELATLRTSDTQQGGFVPRNIDNVWIDPDGKLVADYES